jgi:hypothetical protein
MARSTDPRSTLPIKASAARRWTAGEPGGSWQRWVQRLTATTAAVAILTLVAISSSGPASATTLPSEVCAVSPSLARSFAPECGTNQPSKNYTAQFVVLDSTGFDITWTLPPGVATSCGFHTPCVSFGCHRGDTVCVVSAKNDPQNDQYITVSATIGLLTVGSPATGSSMAPAGLTGPVGGLWPLHLSSTAFIAASCGTPLCHTQ